MSKVKLRNIVEQGELSTGIVMTRRNGTIPGDPQHVFCYKNSVPIVRTTILARFGQKGLERLWSDPVPQVPCFALPPKAFADVRMQKLGLSFWDSFWVVSLRAGKTWWFMMFFGSMTWSQVATPGNAINPWRMRSQTASGWPELGHRSTPIPRDWRNQMEGLKAWSYRLKNV